MDLLYMKIIANIAMVHVLSAVKRSKYGRMLYL